MNEPNNQNNGIYEGYIPPAIVGEKIKSPSKKKILAWLIIPGVLVIVMLVAAFILFYNAITGGFSARYIETEYKTNPPQWNVYGSGINGTATKTLKGDVFEMEIQSDYDKGFLEITVTDTKSGEVLLIQPFKGFGSRSYTVDAGGGKVKFEVYARNFSGHFLIHEEY